MKQATFAINERQYRGWHNPEVRWNGFAVPWFTRATSAAILAEQEIPYRHEGQTFYTLDPYNLVTEYGGESYGGEILYSIGGYEWAWEIEEETE